MFTKKNQNLKIILLPRKQMIICGSKINPDNFINFHKNVDFLPKTSLDYMNGYILILYIYSMSKIWYILLHTLRLQYKNM